MKFAYRLQHIYIIHVQFKLLMYYSTHEKRLICTSSSQQLTKRLEAKSLRTKECIFAKVSQQPFDTQCVELSCLEMLLTHKLLLSVGSIIITAYEQK